MSVRETQIKPDYWLVKEMQIKSHLLAHINKLLMRTDVDDFGVMGPGTPRFPGPLSLSLPLSLIPPQLCLLQRKNWD